MPGNRILGQQVTVAGQVNFGIGKQRPIARQLPGGLVELRLKRARVDLGQQITRLDALSFLKSNTLQLPGNARLDDRRIARRHCAQRTEHDINLAALRRRHRDRRRRLGRAVPPAPRPRVTAIAVTAPISRPEPGHRQCQRTGKAYPEYFLAHARDSSIRYRTTGHPAYRGGHKFRQLQYNKLTPAPAADGIICNHFSTRP